MNTGVPPPSCEMAYVLFMDIVDYSLRSIDEQTELLTILQKGVRGSSEYKHATTDELISLPTGDGMALVFLRDPVSAVKCATEIAAFLQGHSEIKLRMGVHTGPVLRHADIREEVNVVGGGVNMAQRVMDFGDAGHILLSGNVAEVLQQVRGWSDCLRDLGIQEVKHGGSVHLYNLCKDGLGNPALPRKLAAGTNISVAVPEIGNQSTRPSRPDMSRKRQRGTPIRRSRPKHVVPLVLENLLLILAVLSIRAGLLNSPVGRHLKNAENMILQERLIASHSAVSYNDARLPVIIDISETIPSLPDRPTDIAALGTVIDALRELSPQAIGVDIDFSPERAPVRPMDWNTFSKWAKLTRPEDSRPLPIRLGVFRRLYDPPKNWLGRYEFRSLAAGMAVPQDHQNNYYYVQTGTNEDERLLQLAAALHEATGGARPRSGGLLPRIFTEPDGNHQYGVYVVDYSYLQEITDRQVFRYEDPESLPQLLKVWKSKIKDNVVLIGDVGRGEDKFVLAHTAELEPGVLIHACSLMTLRNGPLHYIDAGRSIVLDVIVSFIALLLVVFVTFIIHSRNPGFPGAELLRCWLAAFPIFILCRWWVGWARIFWPDFLWITAALVIAPYFASPLGRLVKRGFEAIFSFSQWIFRGQYNHAR
jgi:class 3 adenylate cyclase